MKYLQGDPAEFEMALDLLAEIMAETYLKRRWGTYENPETKKERDGMVYDSGEEQN